MRSQYVGLVSLVWQLSLSGGTLKQQSILLKDGAGWSHEGEPGAQHVPCNQGGCGPPAATAAALDLTLPAGLGSLMK